MAAEKPLVYLILGAAGSGRRVVLTDLLEDGLTAADRPAVMLAETETADETDVKLPALTRWSWADGQIVGELPRDATHTFFISEGRENPVEQIEVFVAWLESEHWTGNIAFDMQGNPLSLNAAFLELYDDQGDLPEFAGTCMRYSAGTRWLTSTADVVPGESIDLILAIFDLDDVNWDSFVLVDNVRWSCGDAPGPITEPAG